MAVATRLYQNYVNGRFVDAQGDKTLPVENPATGAVVSDVPDSSVEDAREAIECADRAQRPWEKLAPIERANYLHRIATGIRTDAEHLARVLSEEQGKPLDQARGEVERHGELLRLHGGVGPPHRGRGHRQRPSRTTCSCCCGSPSASSAGSCPGTSRSTCSRGRWRRRSSRATPSS